MFIARLIILFLDKLPSFTFQVSTFHELVSAVVQAGDQAMLDNLHSKAQVIIEVHFLLFFNNLNFNVRLDLYF